MTAEIAILNKSAVALATDSAVTITAGGTDKVFDSADKLFELSCVQPIGIMIYNGMQFAGIPLPELIKEFRASVGEFTTVPDAANAFLDFLDEIGRKAPVSVSREVVQTAIHELLEKIDQRVLKLFRASTSTAGGANPPKMDFFSLYQNVIDDALDEASQLGSGAFWGKDALTISGDDKAWLRVEIADGFVIDDDDMVDKLGAVAEKIVLAQELSDSLTGLVIAGFGSDERFPTLVSYEVEGPIFGRLKFRQSSYCDIDRGGPKAFVMPFAQREMVERFLYGLDEQIQAQIIRVCRDAIGSVSDAILSGLAFQDDNQRLGITHGAKSAEDQALQHLKDNAFSVIEESSRRAVEDMVQFMPKPELARMAEALVELTSMKRKVTVGVETVGGPVDVAVISKLEGFVWIKRKHYFPADLNNRFFERSRQKR